MSSTATPPPLPPVTRQIKRAVFKETIVVRFGEVTLDYSMIEKSHEKAEAWINGQPGVDVVQIETVHSGTQAVTVVWYR